MAFRPASQLEITLFEDTDSIDCGRIALWKWGLVRLFEV